MLPRFRGNVAVGAGFAQCRSELRTARENVRSCVGTWIDTPAPGSLTGRQTRDPGGVGSQSVNYVHFAHTVWTEDNGTEYVPFAEFRVTSWCYSAVVSCFALYMIGDD
jgi:hypothetical protein